MRGARKTLRSRRKKAFLVIRTARLSRQDIKEGLLWQINMGGTAEVISSHVVLRHGRFLFSFYNKRAYARMGGSSC